jgi:carboxypeptidase D
MVNLGYGPDCPKSDSAYVDVKLPQREVIHLKRMGFNLTVVEDPVRAEYERFLEMANNGATRTKRGMDERADTFQVPDTQYHGQGQLSAFLDAIVRTFPNIARKYSIGTTVNGAELYAIQISDNPGQNEVGEVEFQYIANMHGDEVVGRELSLYFIYYLCSNYEQVPRIKAIIDNTDIHILPTMNPDGFAGARRGNGHGRDLNRNFPDQFSPQTWGGSFPLPPLSSGDGSFILPNGNHEPEVRAVMQWMGDHNFALAANFHGGSVVANYPFDGNRNRQSGRVSQTPDHLLFRQLSRTYSEANGPMASSREFPSGITNGAEWYVLYGGMQDYAYLWHGSMHITVELSDDKWPNPSALGGFWNDNRESMLNYLERTRYRVWGVVTDCATGQPITTGYVIPAPSSCTDTSCRQQAAKLDKETGDYHRLVAMPDGSSTTSYSLTAVAPGYSSASKSFTVAATMPEPIRVDFCLNKV